MEKEIPTLHCPTINCGDVLIKREGGEREYFCANCANWCHAGDAMRVLEEVPTAEPAAKAEGLCPMLNCRGPLAFQPERGDFHCEKCGTFIDPMDVLPAERPSEDLDHLGVEPELEETKPGEVREGRELTYADRVLLAAPLFAAHQHMHGALTVLLAESDLDETRVSVASTIDALASRWTVEISADERGHMHRVAGLLLSNRGQDAVRNAAGTLAALSAEIRSLGVDLDDAVSAQDAMEEMVRRNREGRPSDA